MKYALNVIMNRGGVSRRHKARGQSHGQGHKKNPRPRTGMLEAKDQGHKCKCFPEKKGLKIFFSVDLQKKRSRKTFSSRSTKF